MRNTSSTHAGYCAMRDRWGADGQVLIFDAGYFGSGHQHDDKLHFVFYAGGRELTGDPCIYSYRRDEFEPYWRGTWSHNTVTIDDLSQDRRAGPAESIPDPDRRFVIGDGFDFAVGWYRRAYSPRGAPLWGDDGKAVGADRAATIRDVQHQRCVFFVKGHYAVIADRVVGKGSHQVDILFHPAPVVTGEGTRRTACAAKLDIRPDGSVVTREPDHANVAILPAEPPEAASPSIRRPEAAGTWLVRLVRNRAIAGPGVSVAGGTPGPVCDRRPAVAAGRRRADASSAAWGDRWRRRIGDRCGVRRRPVRALLRRRRRDPMR